MKLDLKRFMAVLTVSAVLLILAHVIIMVARTNGMELRALHMAFDLNLEGNIPTVYSTMLFFLSAIFSWLLFKHPDRRMPRDRFWMFMSLIFLFLAFDEGGQIHEKFTNLMRREMGERATGVLYFAWVVPYGIAAIVLGAVMAKSLFKQTVKVRNGLILSGAVYFAGAFGLEMLGGSAAESTGHGSNTYLWLAVVEESLEICGLLLFMFTLLRHLKSQASDPVLRFD